jgi:glycosyltransferase involved in cell wall biosynthesis
MVLYNHANHLPEAIESLLGQTYADFGLALVDDCSTDATGEIARRYARADARVQYVPNDQRKGMIGNWRHALDVGRAAFPDAPYFAWVSDHDLWHPLWLERLVAELDAHPEVVLAYPQRARLSGQGAFTDFSPWRFETLGVASARQRLTRASSGMSAGSMIYGLFRASALRPDRLHYVFLPDRLFLSELTLYGQFAQVPQFLYYRRSDGTEVTLARQLAGMFPDRARAPRYLKLPWALVHTGILFRELCVRGRAGPGISRARGGSFALFYGWETLRFLLDRQRRQRRGWVTRWRKGVQRGWQAIRARLSLGGGNAPKTA